MGCRSTLHINHCSRFTGLLFLSVFISEFVSTSSIAVIEHSLNSSGTPPLQLSLAPPPQPSLIPPRPSSASDRNSIDVFVLRRNQTVLSSLYPVRWPDPDSTLPPQAHLRTRRELRVSSSGQLEPALLQPGFERYVERVANGSSSKDHHKNKTVSIPPTPKVVRYYRLHSRCSGGSVQVKGRHVNALAKADSKYARMRVETDSFKSRVRIQSDVTKDYLCFSKVGRLTVKHSGKGDACLFHELHAANHYTEFTSVLNPLWFIGFKKNGQRMVAAADDGQKTGNQTTTTTTRKPAKTRHCFQFMKSEYDYVVSDGVGGAKTGSEKSGVVRPSVVDSSPANGPLIPDISLRYAELIADRNLKRGGARDGGRGGSSDAAA